MFIGESPESWFEHRGYRKNEGWEPGRMEEYQQGKWCSHEGGGGTWIEPPNFAKGSPWLLNLPPALPCCLLLCLLDDFELWDLGPWCPPVMATSLVNTLGFLGSAMGPKLCSLLPIAPLNHVPCTRKSPGPSQPHCLRTEWFMGLVILWELNEVTACNVFSTMSAM